MFDTFCSLFSNMAQPGQYAYESFKKVPQLSVLTQKIPQVSNDLSNILWQFTNNVAQQSIKANDQNLEELIQQSQQNKVIKKIMKSNYTQLITKHKQSATKFTDPDFPPNQSSIGNVQNVAINAQWRRISEVIKNPEFVSDKIQPNDILQGSIGDCYFLSAISALAQYDFRVKNLFPDLAINSYGIYMARILYQGVLREVVVDDYIPVTQNGIPLFAKPTGGNQIWVMILQKCWAKLHGSYGAIVGGLLNQVLHAFSGAPTFYRPINHANKEKQQALWNEMIGAHSSGAILCCGTKGQASVQKAGLVLGHAYTILNLYDTPFRLIKLRNPWSKKQWNGRASDEDIHFWSSIPPIQKQRLGYAKGNNVTFFILWQDFINYFDMIYICKIKDNANYINLDVQFDKKRGEIFEFDTDGGNLTIALSQQSVRGLGHLDERRRGYARSTIIISRHDQSTTGLQYKYIESSSTKLHSQHILELNSLSAGKYIVFAKFDWIRKSRQTATISIYTESKVTLAKSSQSTHSQFLFKTFLDHSRCNPNKQFLSQQSSQWICSQFLLNKCGYGYLAIHLDQKSTKKIGVQINQKQYTQRRLALKKPYKGQGVIKLIVQPGKQCIILFRMKAHNYPLSITLPTPKIFYLV